MQRIAGRSPQADFGEAFTQWRKAHPEIEASDRRALLACIDHYVGLDLDRDGTPDWTAVVDGQLSTVLAPNDGDMDGDGLPNVLDARPLTRSVAPAARRGVPRHLSRSKSRDSVLRQRVEHLYRRHGIVAVDHTDEHAPQVLDELAVILEQGLPQDLGRRLASLRYVYAFAGHDGSGDVAAYHRHLHALSVGGKKAYGSARSWDPETRLSVGASLAHEIGHAVVFDLLSAKELAHVARRFGGWALALTRRDRAKGLYATPFLSRLRGPQEELRSKSIVSGYALTNVHEWFAEAFAAHVLRVLGEKGRFGPRWREALAHPRIPAGGYWVNYDHLAPDFDRWLSERLRRVGRI